jgi:flagellar biosynthesis anti-sigma factor FlgM
MKIADQGPIDTNVTQLVKDNHTVSSVRDRGERNRVERTGEAAQVSISAEARQLQRVAALAERGDELRTEKLNRIKEQLQQGTYHVEAADVAKGILRSEISRLLG